MINTSKLRKIYPLKKEEWWV